MVHTMNKLLVCLLITRTISYSFPSRPTKGTLEACSRVPSTASFDNCRSRREALIGGLGLVVGSSALLGNPVAAVADVSDGNVLPQGAAQFSRVLRLKSDLQGVNKRVSTGGDDIESQEFDNIGKFIRLAYSVSDDMKDIAGGIADPAKKKRALDDIDLLKNYCRAGEIVVNKKSPAGLVPVLEKMTTIVDDFLDALSDVPDEI